MSGVARTISVRGAHCRCEHRVAPGLGRTAAGRSRLDILIIVSIPEELWKRAFEAAPVALSLIDPFGRQIAGNIAYAELLGFEPAELAHVDVGTITLAEDQMWTASYLTRLVSGDLDQFTTHKTYRRKNGEELIARMAAVPIRDDDGKCVALLAALERVSSAEKLSDAKVRSLLSLTTSAVAIIDRTGRIIEASGRYRSLLGYPTTYWDNRMAIDLLDADDVEAATAMVAQVIGSPGSVHVGELRVRAADGSARTLLIEAVNALDDPELEGVVLTAVDVTDQRAMVADLTERQATAEAVAQARTNLLGTVSHELRNPLHAVLGLAELLTAEQLPPHAAEMAATLAQQLSGLTAVTEDLLDTARIDSGSITLTVAPVELRSLVEEVVVHGRMMAGDRALAVAGSVAAEAPRVVLADGGRLRQILRNLVGNAVKFTVSGSVVIDVRPRADGALVFSVIDTGPGIAEHDQTRVLEAFQTGSTAGRAHGAGLGLAIVQRLVSAMHGTLELASREGQGTTIRVVLDLPRAEVPIGDATPARASAGASNVAGMRVLVVEDNAVNQHLARSQLAHLGAVATIVGSGEEALELIQRSPTDAFEVILMDVQLPGIDGAETTRRIRMMDPPRCDIRIMGLTASATVTARARFVDVGMDGFVSKPASLDDIRAAISGGGVGTARNPAHPTAAALTARGEMVNVERLTTLSDEFGDETVVIELVEAFLGELTRRVGAIGVALASGDRVAAKRGGHALGVSAAMLGADDLAQFCRNLEADVADGAASVERIAEATRSELNAWLAGRTRKERRR